jgi:hypothetical protein
MKVAGASVPWAPSSLTMKQKPGVFVRNMQAVLMIATSVQHTSVLRKNNMIKKHPNSLKRDLATLVLMGIVEISLIFCAFYAVFG